MIPPEAIPGLLLIAAMLLGCAWHHGWERGYAHRQRFETEIKALRRAGGDQP